MSQRRLGRAVGARDHLLSLWKHAGASLVGPLILVAVSGVLVLFGYNSDPEVANDRIRDAPFWFDLARSVHLWSSVALLFGAALHLGYTWYARRVDGPYRRAYLTGAVLFALLGLEHLTGHVLRWGDAAQRLASYERALLPASMGSVVESMQLPAHVAGLGGIAFVLALIHIGLVGGGSLTRVHPAFPGGWQRLRGPLIVGLGLGVSAVAVLALALPPPHAQEELPWPFEVLEPAARLGAPGFGLAGIGILLLVGVQPWLERWRWARWTTRTVLVLVLVVSVVQTLR